MKKPESLSPAAQALLQSMRQWEAEHPDALGWIGIDDKAAFERSHLGELRRAGKIRAATTDGFGHPLFHVHPRAEATQ